MKKLSIEQMENVNGGDCFELALFAFLHGVGFFVEPSASSFANFALHTIIAVDAC